MTSSETSEADITVKAPLHDIAMRIILGTVITCENAVLLLVIFKRRLYEHRYVFTASLGVMDLCIGLCLIVSSPLTLGDGSLLAAMASMVITAGMMFMSILQMAIIAVERYLYIAHPFLYERRVTQRVVRATVVGVWMLGVATMAWYAILIACVMRQCAAITRRDAKRIIFISSACSMSSYFCEVILTSVCYTLVIIEVRRHKCAIACSGMGEMVIPKWKENGKSLKFFMTVFGTYFLMTVPFAIWFSVHEFNPAVDDVWGTVTMFSYYANSAANFLIMIGIDHHFRGSLKKVIFSASVHGEHSPTR